MRYCPQYSVMEGTASETGENLFKALIENLTKVLNIKGAQVTEYNIQNRQLNSLAFCLSGKWVVYTAPH